MRDALAAAGSTGSIGPNLDERLGRHTRASPIASLDARELDSLVRFLLAAR